MPHYRNTENRQLRNMAQLWNRLNELNEYTICKTSEKFLVPLKGFVLCKKNNQQIQWKVRHNTAKIYSAPPPPNCTHYVVGMLSG